MGRQCKQWQTLILGAPQSLQMVTAAMKLKNTCFLEESYDQPRQHVKKQSQYLANKGPSNQSYGFSSIHVWMWELDHKESWTLKNWCFWTVVLEKTLESPLDCKKIIPVNPKGNRFWIFIGRTDAEAEAPILWPPDPGKNWGQEEKRMTEDEMVGWYHQLDGHEFEQAPGVGDGQVSLVFCSSWNCKELDRTEQLKWRIWELIPGYYGSQVIMHKFLQLSISAPVMGTWDHRLHSWSQWSWTQTVVELLTSRKILRSLFVKSSPLLIRRRFSHPSRFPWIHLPPSSMTADRAKSSVAILCHTVGGHILEGAPAFSPVSSLLCPCLFYGHSYVHPSTLTQSDVSTNSTSRLITVLLCTRSDFPPICRCPNWTTTLNMAILFTLCQHLPSAAHVNVNVSPQLVTEELTLLICIIKGVFSHLSLAGQVQQWAFTDQFPTIPQGYQEAIGNRAVSDFENDQRKWDRCQYFLSLLRKQPCCLFGKHRRWGEAWSLYKSLSLWCSITVLRIPF